MQKYGLIGYPLKHSLSKKYFEKKFHLENIEGAEYELYPLDKISDIDSLIENTDNLRGLNVTIPYKIPVLEYLDELDEEAQKIGAVNCIKISRKKGKIQTTGYNTDTPAFIMSLLPFLQSHHKMALVLGSGGASAAVCRGLDVLHISWLKVSRDPKGKDISYAEISSDILASSQLIINTTPLGMYPDVNECPKLNYKALTPLHLLYDLVYNPELSLFLKKGKAAGAIIKNGEEMFFLQAELSWKIWEI